MNNTIDRICKLAVVTLGCCLILAQVSYADPISWVDWTSANTTSAVGTVDGVTVNFSGNLSPAAVTSGGGSFWAVNSSTYTSPEVDNPPPTSDIIRLTGGPTTGIQTITFSQGIVNPVMAILSLGQPSIAVQYVFNAGFDILNSGPGFFGNGPLTELPGNILQGLEGNGIIQFSGTFTSISWTIPTGEFWHGFQIGIAGVAGPGPGPTPLPAPSSLSLLGLGFAGLAFAYRKRAHQALLL